MVYSAPWDLVVYGFTVGFVVMATLFFVVKALFPVGLISYWSGDEDQRVEGLDMKKPIFAEVDARPASAVAVTLPDVGADVPGHITAAITALGTVVVSVLGAWFSFVIVRKSLSWVRTALSGR